MGCSTCGNIVHGVLGLAKVCAQVVGLPIDPASAPIIAARRDICRNCPHATRTHELADRPSRGLTSRSRCVECGCLIKAKTMLASESCPIDSWRPETIHGG